MNNASPFDQIKELFPQIVDTAGVWGVVEVLVKLGIPHKGSSLATCEIALKHQAEIRVEIVRRRLVDDFEEGFTAAHQFNHVNYQMRRQGIPTRWNQLKELKERKGVMLRVEL